MKRKWKCLSTKKKTNKAKRALRNELEKILEELEKVSITEIIRTYGRVKPKINRENIILEGSMTSFVDLKRANLRANECLHIIERVYF